MKIALLGAGRIGRLHGRLIAAQPEVDEVIVHDVDASRARDAAAEVGGRAVGRVTEALAAADAAVIAASTDAHAALVSQAIDARLPIFVEKPLAFDLGETVALVEKAEVADAVIQVGFQRRFDPAYAEARRLVETGQLGTVYLVRLVAHDHEPPHDTYIPVSGGLFRDASIHDFDVVRWVTGVEVAEVYAAGAVRRFEQFARHGDIDTAAVVLTLTDGTLAVLGQTRHDPRGYDVRMELIGSLDAVSAGMSSSTPIRSLEADAVASSRPPWTSFLTRFKAAYRAELLAFLRLVNGEIASPCTARDALQAMRISVAATMSRLEHRPVEMSEIP